MFEEYNSNMSKVYKQYERSETVYVQLKSYNSSGTLTALSGGATCTIMNPQGTVLVDAQAMSTDETGIYYYKYTLDSAAILGKYWVTAVGTDGTDVTIEKDAFLVQTKFGD